MASEAARRKPAKEQADPALRHQIDENLRRVYEDALQEDVPDRFKDLLERLRTQETPKK